MRQEGFMVLHRFVDDSPLAGVQKPDFPSGSQNGKSNSASCLSKFCNVAEHREIPNSVYT